MKKLTILNIFLVIAISSLAQGTFTSKQEALKYVKEAFEANFIKTAVYKINDTDNIPFIFDFEITESQIIIWSGSNKTATSIDKKKAVWQNIPFEKIGELLTINKGDVFKDLTGLAIKPNFGNSFITGIGGEISDTYTGKYSTNVIFPFSLPKNKKEKERMMQSLYNAINFISDEIKIKLADLIKKDKKLKADEERQRLIIQETISNKINFNQLPPYIVFTYTNSTISLPDYINKNRLFKNMPTLLITWSDVYCKPCIKIIDALLNNGVGLKYNIILVNKEDNKTDFEILKTKISSHTPDYNKDAILLFDKNNQLEPIDKNTAPFFIWLDKNLKIVRSYAGYDIRATTISNILAEIE